MTSTGAWSTSSASFRMPYFGKFMARAALLPVSRELYEEYSRTWTGIHNPVKQAVRWYYIARQSFSAGCSATVGARRSIRRVPGCRLGRLSGSAALTTCRASTSGCSASRSSAATCSNGSAAMAGWHTAKSALRDRHAQGGRLRA